MLVENISKVMVTGGWLAGWMTTCMALADNDYVDVPDFNLTMLSPSVY